MKNIKLSCTKKMKKTLCYIAVLLSAQSVLLRAESETAVIKVRATTIEDVSGEAIQSADLADALFRKIPSASLIRRSGIANDIILRGQNKDNINVLIDGGKIYGACPNRMDPPVSHILSNNVESIQIVEGPYDVENFGTLSGAIKLKTQKPEKQFRSEVSLNVGSWQYQKLAARLSGGNDWLQALVSLSREKSAQYEDGDGNTFAQQIKNKSASSMTYLKPQYEEMDAYDKQTFMGKVYLNLLNNHQMSVAYTANRSDDILYPSSKMDALYDDSNLLNVDYSIKNLGRYSRQLDFQYYDSDVEHPMSTFYRNSSAANAANERISLLTTRVQGLKLKNHIELSSNTQLKLGIDSSLRNWNGYYIGRGMNQWINGRTSIDDVDTRNIALFAELEKLFTQFSFTAGVRVDDTQIQTASADLPENNYNALNAFVHSTYQYLPGQKIFLGLGKSSRVPDARELYFKQAGMNPNMPQPMVGTPDLEDTQNYEIDLAFENTFEQLSIHTKLFHSWLKDYIYYNADKKMNNFENIDARLYGIDISGLYIFSDTLYADFGISWQRGQKDQPLAGQSDTDLANIPPLKMILGVNYEYAISGLASMNIIAADAWRNYDADNGEQALAGYVVVNLKVAHQLNRNLAIKAGVDNLFNRTYAVNNTYKDLTLLTAGTGEVMLLNEPGRYFYIHGSYQF